MSYNVTKVSSKEPDRSSSIELNLSDVSSVSAPSADEILGHNGTDWINRPVSWVSEYEESSRTVSGGTTSTNSNDIPIPRTNLPAGEQYFFAFAAKRILTSNYMSVVNTSNTTITEHALNANADYWYKVGINNAGLYRLWAKLAIGSNSSSTSSLEVQWSNADNSVTYGARARLHRDDQKQAQVIGYINATGGESVGLYKHANNNNAKIPLEAYRDHLIVIEKLS